MLENKETQKMKRRNDLAKYRPYLKETLNKD